VYNATMSEALIEKVVEQLRTLPKNLQTEVLQFLVGLKQSQPIGVAGASWSEYANLFPPEDLGDMADAINEDSGKIDLDEW